MLAQGAGKRTAIRPSNTRNALHCPAVCERVALSASQSPCVRSLAACIIISWAGRFSTRQPLPFKVSYCNLVYINSPRAVTGSRFVRMFLLVDDLYRRPANRRAKRNVTDFNAEITCTSLSDNPGRSLLVQWTATKQSQNRYLNVSNNLSRSLLVQRFAILRRLNVPDYISDDLIQNALGSAVSHPADTLSALDVIFSDNLSGSHLILSFATMQRH